MALVHVSHMFMCMSVCVGESDLVGLHPAGGLLYEIKLDEGESSALTWTPPSAMVTEQQQHNNNAGQLVLLVQSEAETLYQH